jgi:hypothetical protein
MKIYKCRLQAKKENPDKCIVRFDGRFVAIDKDKYMLKKRIEEIKNLIDAGVKVYDENEGYECFKTKSGDYAVKFKPNGYTIGMFWDNDTKMNITAPFYYHNGKRIEL